MNGSSSTGSKASSPTSNGDAGTAGVSSSQGSAAQCNGGAAAAAVSPDTSAAGKSILHCVLSQHHHV